MIFYHINAMVIVNYAPSSVYISAIVALTTMALLKLRMHF